MQIKTAVGGLIACILLGIYGYLMWLAITVVKEGCNAACQADKFNTNMATALMTIGGLVSGVIITELAITGRNETPGMRFLDSQPTRAAITALTVVVVAYISVWLISGLAAFIVALKNPNAHKPLQDVANAWLGLALAAAYAYFGITPHKPQSPRP